MPPEFFIGVAIWGLLKIFCWHTKNRISSFIMLWSNKGYLKNMSKKREIKEVYACQILKTDDR